MHLMGYSSVADIIGLSSFVQPLLPPKIPKSGEIPTKFDITAVQGHPRSSILVSIESSHTTFYQSLTVTLAVSATVFEILTLKARKSLNFPTPPLFEASARGTPQNLVMTFWRQKTRIMGLPEGEEIMTPCHVLTQYRLVTDRQTDGGTDTLLSLLPALAQRRAGKKYIQWVTTLSLTIRFIVISLAVVASQICEIQRKQPTKFELIAVRGHLRPSILAPVESACNFLLVLDSNCGRISYRFRDIDV